MASLTLQKQKEIYSRDLAAYTLRQWNAVRKVTPPLKPKDEKPVKSPDTTPDSGYEPQTKKKRHSYPVDRVTTGTTLLDSYPSALDIMANPSS